MVVTGGEFEQAVVEGDVHVRIADREIGVADVRRRHGESHELMHARRDAALFHAAKRCGQIFRSDHPVLPERRLVDDEIGLPARLTCDSRREPERGGEERGRRQADHHALFHEVASCVGWSVRGMCESVNGVS